jgi:putative hydrolase of the HAD superfamily
MASNFDARLRSIVGGIPELAPLRERCVVSSLVGWRKPSPSFFRAVAEAAGWVPEHILFVGDQPENDFDGAKAAGMLALLYDPGGSHRTAASIVSLRELL